MIEIIKSNFIRTIKSGAVVFIIFPMSYLYTKMVLQVKTLTNYYVGLFMNLFLGIMSLGIAISKFKKKDFSGSI